MLSNSQDHATFNEIEEIKESLLKNLINANVMPKPSFTFCAKFKQFL